MNKVKNKNEKISIIVPCYNNEKYISRCLNSIINQSYRELEIIVINDGSNDNSESIIKKYKEIDKRIIFINKNNEGVSKARNYGMEIATGNYIMFIDSDDWIELDTCKIAINTMLKYDCDVVMWSYIREFSNNSIKKKTYKDNIIVFEEEDVKNKLLRRMIGIIDDEMYRPQDEYAFNPIWTKLYKSEIIKKNNIKFKDLKEIGTGEDGLFNIIVFKNCKKVVYINEYLYHYVKENEKSCNSKYIENLDLKWRLLFEEILKETKEYMNNSNFYNAYNNRVCLSIIWLGLNISRNNENILKKINNIKKIITDEEYCKYFNNIKIKNMPFHWKMFFICVRYKCSTLLYFLIICMKFMIGKF